MLHAHTLTDVLVSVKDVSLQFGEAVILKDVNAEVRDIVRPGVCQGQVVGILGPSGIGKCLAKGTPILMFDGSVRNVEDVRQGDLLMGPDSRPRRVLNLGRGLDMMYQVTPVKGDPFTTNSEHILALHVGHSKRSKARYEEISVLDYLKQSRTFKNRAKLYRVGVDFPDQAVPLDPYFFGIWLGDGNSYDQGVSNQDFEVLEAVEAFAQASGAQVSTAIMRNGCPRVYAHNFYSKEEGTVLKLLRSTGALNNKHVPLVYKANSRSNRLQLLAGILDSDGHLAESNCYEVTSKIKALADDYCYLARSLGFAAYCTPSKKKSQNGTEGVYHRVTISGDIDEIPVRISRKKASPRKQIKSVLRTGFNVESVGFGAYYGFELDGDGLFLLGDFTVTHNTQFSRILAGLQEPTTGSVQLHLPVEEEGKADRYEDVLVAPGKVGMVFQNYPLFAHRTVMGNLLVALEHTGLSKKDRTDKIMPYLEKFDLVSKVDLFPAQLSGGQRQRVAIIQELLGAGHYIVMDEPFTGLDPIMKDMVCDLINLVANLDERNTIFVVAHDISALVQISDYLWLFGRERDEKGQPIPGAHIKKTYDLIERGLAWRPDISTTREFQSFVSEVREQFHQL